MHHGGVALIDEHDDRARPLAGGDTQLPDGVAVGQVEVDHQHVGLRGAQLREVIAGLGATSTRKPPTSTSAWRKMAARSVVVDHEGYATPFRSTSRITGSAGVRPCPQQARQSGAGRESKDWRGAQPAWLQMGHRRGPASSARLRHGWRPL
jgi:hypothetical protein